MKKMMMLAVIALMTLISCSVDNDDVKTDNYRSQIANTHWLLSEIRDANNSWQKAVDYPVLEIPELWFSAENGYTMKIAEGEGHGLPATVSGTYDFDNGSITMTDDRYQGIAYSLKIQSLNSQLLEGLFTLWHEKTPKYYTIRLQRKK
jgi:hypothetical protein